MNRATFLQQILERREPWDLAVVGAKDYQSPPGRPGAKLFDQTLLEDEGDGRGFELALVGGRPIPVLYRVDVAPVHVEEGRASGRFDVPAKLGDHVRGARVGYLLAGPVDQARVGGVRQGPADE